MVCVLSRITAGCFMSDSRPAVFFKSALVLNHSFKDCLPQVNPGHMNIFMKKDPSPRFGLCI